MTLEQLKARAYDLLAGIEAFQRELQATNKLIANYKAPVEEVTAETVVEDAAAGAQ